MLRKAYTPARLLAEGVLLIAAGILLFFYPASSLELALLLARWILLVSGLLALLDGLFHLREKKASLTKGLLMLLCAGALFFLPKTLAGSVSLIYGLWTAVNALFKLIYAVQLRRDGQRGVVLNAAEGAVLLVFAVLLFMQPLIGALSLAVLLGIHSVYVAVFPEQQPCTALHIQIRDDFGQCSLPNHVKPQIHILSGWFRHDSFFRGLRAWLLCHRLRGLHRFLCLLQRTGLHQLHCKGVWVRKAHVCHMVGAGVLSTQPKCTASQHRFFRFRITPPPDSLRIHTVKLLGNAAFHMAHQ